MKKHFTILMLVLFIMSLTVCGCSAREGYIIRDNITMEDLEFVYEGTDQRMDITIEDMYSSLGLPYSSSGYYGTEYGYRIEKGTVSLKFDKYDDFIGARFYLLDDVPEPTPFEIGEVEIDENKYKMKIRNDIGESEIAFINEDTTSVEVQEELGAPHGGISNWQAQTRTDVYYYNMTSGNTLKITYERFGVISQAWIEDKDADTIDILISKE